MAWYIELAEAALTSTSGRDELKYIRAAMNSYSTYTMDNIRFCTRRAPMLHKQSTGCGLQVTDKVRFGRFFVAHFGGYEHATRTIRELLCSDPERRLDKEATMEKIRDPSTISAVVPETARPELIIAAASPATLAIPPLTTDGLKDYEIMEELSLLGAVSGTFNERITNLIIMHHGGYTEALEAIAKAASSFIREGAGAGEGVVVTAKSRLARYFVAHLSGNENAVRTFRELLEVNAL